MFSITRYSKKQKDFLKTNYNLGGDGVAFDSMKQFKNYLFFHNIKVTSVKNANGSKILFLSDKLYKSCGIDLRLSDTVATNANDLLVLENGDYVLIQKKDNKLTSLFMGYHEKNNMCINYQFARNILNKIQFNKFDMNINRNDNQIVIIDFLELDSKVIAKITLITINTILTPDDKKEFIRKYNDKYLNSVIMHHNNLFYILKSK